MKLKYVPKTIGILNRATGGFIPDATVTRVITYPPGLHPAESCIYGHMTAVQIVTPYGSRWYGTERAFIDSSLQMVMAVNERDEVLARWQDYRVD